jgi:polysaccharide biosynthesis protein PslH
MLGSGFPHTSQHHPSASTGRRRVRLLFLLPFAPGLNATHGGGRVMAQLVTELATRHSVALIYLRTSDELPADAAVQACCEVVEEVVLPPSDPAGAQRWWRRLRYVRSLLRGKPLWVEDSRSPAFGRRVQSLLCTWHPDIVHLEYHVMAQYLPALESCPTPRVLTEYEPGAESARDRWRSERGFAKLVRFLDMLAWEHFERSILKDVQAVVAFTERDRQALRRLIPGLPILQIPPGTPLPEQPLDPLGSSPLSLVFVGNFLHPPNADAAYRLISSVFPSVQARFPDTVLYIVGDHASTELCRMATKRVLVTGRVPDVQPYLDRAALVVVPLRLGGGIRVKVLEAVAAGKAVVTSSLAIEGLDLIDGRHVVLAESDEEFADAIIELLEDPDRRASLAAHARNWACANLGWERAITAYESLYEALVSSRKSGKLSE